MSEEKIWYQDLYNFITNPNHILDIIPDKSMNVIQQLNAIMRFTLYFTLVLLLLKRDLRVIVFLILAGVLTWIINIQNANEADLKQSILEKLKIEEDVLKRPCYQPTAENPFMNVSYVDYKEFPNRPKACDLSKKEVEDKVNNLFEDGFIRATDDIYNRSGSDRQFYTNAATTIPNDQDSFTRWCYKIPRTPKEDGITNFFSPVK